MHAQERNLWSHFGLRVGGGTAIDVGILCLLVAAYESHLNRPDSSLYRMGGGGYGLHGSDGKID